MSDTITFGQRLRDLRLDAGLSCRALDAVAGLHNNHTAHLERGDNCAAVTARKIAVALGCTVGWLLAGEGERPTRQQILDAVERARPAPPAVELIPTDRLVAEG